ncbi:hypothetical protein V2P20_02820 [Methylobacter sp. Wu1]|uniref:hypothetical protein n=1 Tax=Methylobacter sp. Wu1 TaxID=3119359 RepID=UPI002F92A0F6
MVKQKNLKKFFLINKTKKILFYLLLLSLTFSQQTFAEDDRRFIDVSKSPIEGITPQSFVPNGWAIEKKVEGDLNSDKQPDMVLELIENEAITSKKNEKSNPRYRAMLVLFKTQEGKFKLATTADHLLPCSICGGTYAVPDIVPQIKINRGIIIIETEFGGGSKETCRQVQRFRYDLELNKFVLIGADVNIASENTLESTNYLTGVKLIEQFKYDESSGKDAVISTRKETVSKEKKLMEQLDYEDSFCL